VLEEQPDLDGPILAPREIIFCVLALDNGLTARYPARERRRGPGTGQYVAGFVREYAGTDDE